MKKTLITKQMKTKAYDLAKKGFTNKSIYESFGISKSSFYLQKDLLDTIKKGRTELKKKVSESILKNAVDLHNPTVQIFLAKKLRLFDDTFDSISLKNSDDVIKMISKLFEAVSNGSISDDKANQLKSIIDTFTKVYEQNVLEDRVNQIEEVINETKKQN